MSTHDPFSKIVTAWMRACDSTTFSSSLQAVQELLTTDLLQSYLQRLVPQWQQVETGNNSQPWRCGSCRKLIMWTTHVSLHRCAAEHSPKWPCRAMLAAGMTYEANGQRRCLVCRKPIGGTLHQCTATVLRTVLVDFSATERGDTDALRADLQLSQARRACGLVAFVTANDCVPRAATCCNLQEGVPYMRMLVLVARSGMAGAGRGAFATAAIPDDSVICGYTGLRIATPGAPHDNAEPLANQTVRGIVRDPSQQGGMAFIFNCGHNNMANMLSMEGRKTLSRTPLMLLKTQCDVTAGTELLWDYEAITDDQNDPLLRVLCVCGACDPGTALVTYVATSVRRTDRLGG